MQCQDNIVHMDERSFQRFIELYSSDLLYYARYLLHTKEEAEEIVSDVFFEVWQNKDKLHEIRNQKVWLITITHNKAISYLRKRDYASSPVSWDEVGDNIIPADLQTPDQQLISREEMARINCVINSLPPRCKQVFVLAKVEKLPYKDIANILDISVKTINAHIARALELISEALEK